MNTLNLNIIYYLFIFLPFSCKICLNPAEVGVITINCCKFICPDFGNFAVDGQFGCGDFAFLLGDIKVTIFFWGVLANFDVGFFGEFVFFIFTKIIVN